MCRRRRPYHIMVSKRKAQVVGNIEETYQQLKLAFGPLNDETPPGSFLQATDVDIQDALAEARCRSWQRSRCSCGAAALASCTCTFEMTLSEGQRLRLHKFRDAWELSMGTKADSDNRAYFHLNDNPDFRRVWSGASGQLPALRRSMGPVWAASRSRPVLPRELLLSMGWLPYKDLSNQVGLDPHFCDFCNLNLGQLLGNSMHLGNASMVLAAALSCIRCNTPGSNATTEQDLIASFRNYAQ